jgi:hypothetical protein
MHVLKRDNWFVARVPGRRLFLGGGRGADPSFAGMGPSTFFFGDAEFDDEIERMGLSPGSVVKTPVSLEMRVGL